MIENVFFFLHSIRCTPTIEIIFVRWDLWMRHDNYDEDLIIVCVLFIYLFVEIVHCQNACDESWRILEEDSNQNREGRIALPFSPYKDC